MFMCLKRMNVTTWAHGYITMNLEVILFIQAKVKQPSQDVYAVVNKNKGDSAKAKQTVSKYLYVT